MILPGIAAILAASVSVAARMAAISGVKGVRMVKNRWWGFLLLVASAVGLFACTMPTEADEIAAGRQVYTQNCAICHQPDGEGYAQVFPHLAKSDCDVA